MPKKEGEESSIPQRGKSTVEQHTGKSSGRHSKRER